MQPPEYLAPILGSDNLYQAGSRVPTPTRPIFGDFLEIRVRILRGYSSARPVPPQPFLQGGRVLVVFLCQVLYRLPDHFRLGDVSSHRKPPYPPDSGVIQCETRSVLVAFHTVIMCGNYVDVNIATDLGYTPRGDLL